MRAACIATLRDIAKRDPRIVFIGSDLSPALVESSIPNRWFMEGVAEQHMIGMAAGLALDGFIPYCNTIATFITRRCYDQIAVDLCMHNLPVRLIGNGGGLTYSPLGPTHLAIEDIAIMRALPNMTVVCPCDAEEMVRVMEASVAWPGPMYIRMARGWEKNISGAVVAGFAIGKAAQRIMQNFPDPFQTRVRTDALPGVDISFMSTGAMTAHCIEAANILAELECTVTHFHTVKPLDEDAVKEQSRCQLLVTVEEGTKIGGLGSAITDAIASKHHFRASVGEGAPGPPILRLGIPDVFPKGYGTREELWEQCGLMPAQIAEAVRRAL